jgi:hypothetical protein
VTITYHREVMNDLTKDEADRFEAALAERRAQGEEQAGG